VLFPRNRRKRAVISFGIGFPGLPRIRIYAACEDLHQQGGCNALPVIDAMAARIAATPSPLVRVSLMRVRSIASGGPPVQEPAWPRTTGSTPLHIAGNDNTGRGRYCPQTSRGLLTLPGRTEARQANPGVLTRPASEAGFMAGTGQSDGARGLVRHEAAASTWHWGGALRRATGTQGLPK